MNATTDLVGDLVGLDALDLSYLITTCKLPSAWRSHGERAARAERQARTVVDDLVPGGFKRGYTVAQYAAAGSWAWEANGYTYEGVLRS